VPESEIELARQGTSRDPAIAAIVAFAQQVLAAPAEIGDADLDRLHAHGYRDEQIAEVAGLVSLQLLTGAFNLIAGIHAPAEALRELAPRRPDRAEHGRPASRASPVTAASQYRQGSRKQPAASDDVS
jgi:uncharacterized protein YciW